MSEGEYIVLMAGILSHGELLVPIADISFTGVAILFPVMDTVSNEERLVPRAGNLGPNLDILFK
jgi:hypothetical protein